MSGGPADPEAAPTDRVTQRDVLNAVNGVGEQLGERIDAITAEFRQWREAHERRHLEEMRTAIEDHAEIGQLAVTANAQGTRLTKNETDIQAQAQFWAELKGMGTMLKLVFGTSIVGALSGVLALIVVLRDLA